MTAPQSVERRRAVLLLHGLCSSPLEVRQFARQLRDAGFDVFTPTPAGYTEGGSGADDADDATDYRRWIAQCVREIDGRLERYGEIRMCGISMGATLALAVAAERPGAIAGLSLISTTLFYDGWNVSRWRFLLPLAYYTPLGHLYRYRETPPYGVKNPRVREFIARELERGRLSSAGAATISTRSLREADRLIRHVKRNLHRVRAPLLMIHAQNDDVASLENVHFVRQRVGASTYRELIVRDSYHMITLDNDRDRAALKTVQFFNSHAGPAAGPAAPAAAHPLPEGGNSKGAGKS